MPIPLHLFLATVTQVGGAVFLPVVLFKAAIGKRVDGATLFGAFLLGFLIPRLVFKYLIPARCPKCGRNKAFFYGGQPIKYRCKSYGHVRRTSVKEGESW
jgi:hypothetical protein